jgi:hypothetical protein
MGGQIIDATIVSAPKQHNSREENETIKEGKTPEDWKSKLAKNRQKDKDARWTKKHERSYFGYKAADPVLDQSTPPSNDLPEGRSPEPMIDRLSFR